MKEVIRQLQTISRDRGSFGLLKDSPPYLRLLARVIVLALGLLLTALPAQTARADELIPCPDTPSAEYLSALDVADQFLAAWDRRDQTKGVELVSSELRKKAGEDKLRDYLSGLSDPYHASFTIGCGRRAAGTVNTFEFPVTLNFLYSGEKSGSAYKSFLRVARTQDCGTSLQGWCVSSLPSSYDLEVAN
jgi:hypothetical protein